MKFYLNFSRCIVVCLLLMVSFTALAGPFDSVGPYDFVSMLTVIFSVGSLVLLLIIDLVIWLLLAIRKKKWKRKYWFLFNSIYVVLMPTLIYALLYWEAYNQDSARREALRAGQSIIERYSLENARVDDNHFYYTKSVYQNNVILLHNLDSIPDQIKRQIDSVPCLIEKHHRDSIWKSYYKY